MFVLGIAYILRRQNSVMTEFCGTQWPPSTNGSQWVGFGFQIFLDHEMTWCMVGQSFLLIFVGEDWTSGLMILLNGGNILSQCFMVERLPRNMNLLRTMASMPLEPTSSSMSSSRCWRRHPAHLKGPNEGSFSCWKRWKTKRKELKLSNCAETGRYQLYTVIWFA